MFHGEFTIADAVDAIHEAFRSFQAGTATSGTGCHVPALAVGVAITAVAGVAVAMAVGGTLLYSRRTHLKRRKRKHLPLTQKQWRDAFETESGRLMDGEKVLKRIRGGGVEPSIRAEVWPFLLDFYDLESTRSEREAERTLKREEYEDLIRKCSLLREKIANESREAVEVEDGFVDIRPIESQQDTTSVLQNEDHEQISATVPSGVDDSTAGTRDMSSSGAKEVTHGNEELLKPDSTADRPLNQVDKDDHGEASPQATEAFITWQRIIRLDAVRMNAEWVPYSPSQASVTQEAARQLAMAVGLKDDEHLEPCLRHHAARLVAILEAYALYDPETGYCQGMSDLLSPFVALLDEDYKAFWCFAYFMYTARHNFRLDEVGIRRQLNMVSRIFKMGDQQLYKHLQSIQAEECFFVYRMVVVLMRRELSFEQTISFWEVLWADKTAVRLGKVKISCRKGRRRAPPTDDLLLYAIAAAVRRKRKFIIEKCRGMDEILRECNSMAGHLDVWALLDDARELVVALHDKFPA